MNLCAFIGDEVSAAGFRLAGVDIYVPAPLDVPALFQRLLEEAQIVLITTEMAARVSQDGLGRALAAERPLVLVVPDLRSRARPADLSAAVRRQLGMAE